MAKILTLALLFFGLFVCSVPVLRAQTTNITYQGSLKDGANAANGNYDFEFVLFDAVTGGNQLGLIPRNAVAVMNGTFAVVLDFSGGSFPGADRFLEIRVRNTGGGAFIPLIGRQKFYSSPYAIKSLTAENAASATTANNALQLGGVAANLYVTTSTGNTNYIQNQNAGAQAASNFSISGNGTAGGTLTGNTVSAMTQLNIGGIRFVSGGTCTPSTTVTEGDLNPGGILIFGVSSGPNNVSIDHVNAGTGMTSLTLFGSPLNAVVNIPAFTSGTFNPVVVTFTVVDRSQAVDFTLRGVGGTAIGVPQAAFIRVRCTAGITNQFVVGQSADTVHFPGSVTKAYTTGTANVAIPVAFGYVTAAGTVTGTPNITSATWSSTGICDVVISGITYNPTDFSTVITPVLGSSSVRMATGSSLSGDLRVRVFEITGGVPALVSNAFHFVVFRNQ